MSNQQTNQQTQIIKVPAPVLAIFSDLNVIKDFEDILHGGKDSFIKSALICISSSYDLMNCTPQSLAAGALRSATIGLSLDPALRQAWLVPRKGVACFQPHYHGLYDLAVRTNQYRTISVSPIYQGEDVVEDPRTGMHYIISEGTDWLSLPHRDKQGLESGYRKVTNGKSVKPVIGYFGYFMTVKGFEKTVWMTLREIQAHAMKWSPSSYNSEKGAWQDPRKRPTMEMKTVFIALSKFMDLSGPNNSKLKAAIEADNLDDENTVTVIPTDVSEQAEAQSAPETNPEPEVKAESFAPTPLQYESAVPGPAKTVTNNVIIDSEWERFTKLVETANKAGLVTMTYNRLKMTPDLLNGASAYLKGAIEKAKAKK